MIEHVIRCGRVSGLADVAFHAPLAGSLIAALSSGGMDIPSGVMVLSEVTLVAPHDGFRRWVVAMYGAGSQIDPHPIGPREIDQPPPPRDSAPR